MSYLARLLLTAVAVLIAVAAINFVVDPFGVFRAQVDGLPQDRQLFETNTRLAKARIAARLMPEAIVLGSSRAEIGISPTHPAWRFERVYNLALPMASIEEETAYLRHAIALGSLRQAVVGLDFFQFNPGLQPRADFSECRLLEPGSVWSRIRTELCDLPTLLLSRKALEGSIKVLRGNGATTVYLRDGSRDGTAKEKLIAHAGSQHAAFLETELEFYRQPELLRGYLESEAGFEETSGRHFEEFLRLAYANSIDLRVYISPTHARHLEVIDLLGLWDDFVRWKRYLMYTNIRIAREFGKQPYAIWDFANYGTVNSEDVPPPDAPDARIKWYWESSHFTRALGDLVLDYVLAGRPGNAGVVLESARFRQWMQEIESRRAQYRLDHAEEINEIEKALRGKAGTRQAGGPPIPQN